MAGILQAHASGTRTLVNLGSERAQIEVAEDQYPLLLVNGLRVAEMVLRMMNKGGFGTVNGLLDEIDRTYEASIERRRPDQKRYSWSSGRRPTFRTSLQLPREHDPTLRTVDYASYLLLGAPP